MVRFVIVLVCFFPALLFAQGNSDARPPLKVNILQSYPFGYVNDAGDNVGTYWEYVAEIEKLSEIPIARSIIPKSRVVANLKSGLADAAILFKSARLSAHVTFVEKVRSVPIILVTRKGTTIRRYDELYEFSGIGIYRGSSVSPTFDSDTRLKKQEIVSYPALVKMLMLERVDVIVGNGIVIQALIDEMCVRHRVQVAELSFEGKEQWLVMSKKSIWKDKTPELRATVNKLKSNGQLDDIFYRHVTQTRQNCQ